MRMTLGFTVWYLLDDTNREAGLGIGERGNNITNIYLALTVSLALV
jgi:hypothetical protein